MTESTGNLLYSVGNVLVAFGALAVLLGAVGSVWGERVRERYSAQHTAETAQQTQQAIRDAGAAHERAAVLEKEAANARLSVEKLKSKLAWREITETQTAEFCGAVVGLPKTRIVMQYQNTDQEAASFAAQLCEMFLKAGFDAPDAFDKMYGVSPTGGMMIGVNMKVSDARDKAGVGIQLALKKIGIEANGQVISNEPGVIIFDVGQKPPPLSR